MHIEDSVPMDDAVAALGQYRAQNAHFYWGYDGHMLTFLIEHGKTMNVVAFRTKKDGIWEHGAKWVLPGDNERMLSDYEGWGKGGPGNPPYDEKSGYLGPLRSPACTYLPQEGQDMSSGRLGAC